MVLLLSGYGRGDSGLRCEPPMSDHLDRLSTKFKINRRVRNLAGGILLQEAIERTPKGVRRHSLLRVGAALGAG